MFLQIYYIFSEVPKPLYRILSNISAMVSLFTPASSR